MNEINITGLKVEACHGVLDFEKTCPQNFIFDIKLKVDFFDAAMQDDLTKTVNYADVCSLVTKITTENCFNLIEKLAYTCAYAILNKYSMVKCATITVNKPQAPVGLPFGNISVTATVERNDVYLSIGSSMGDSKALFDQAIQKLNQTEGVQVKKVSSFITTEPYGGVAQNKFLNGAIKIECYLSPIQLLDVLHKIEEEAGRQRNVRWEDRTLDLDIVFFGNKVIRQEGLSVPHPDYLNRDFVILPLKEIAPNLVCPINGIRLSDVQICHNK